MFDLIKARLHDVELLERFSHIVCRLCLLVHGLLARPPVDAQGAIEHVAAAEHFPALPGVMTVHAEIPEQHTAYLPNWSGNFALFSLM